MSSAALTTSTTKPIEPSSSNQAISNLNVTTTGTTKPYTTYTKESNIINSSPSSNLNLSSNPAICIYFQRGFCRFGSLCYFSHDLNCGEAKGNSATSDLSATNERPSTSRHNWANAPVFVPKSKNVVSEVIYNPQAHSWADVVGATGSVMGSSLSGEKKKTTGSVEEICPFEGGCPYGVYCAYSIHLELCEMCDQFCLHPTDESQRKKHKKECLQQHEQAMELSFAIARSKDKTCGICFDTIMEKASRERRFGILPNCNHIFCLECIRKWRQAKQFEHKISRSCPECRVASDFVCPSEFWVETKEEKAKLLGDYRKALGIKDCKYFQKGDGKCPFGNKCFYKHALPNGELVDVGCPRKARKMIRSNNDIINLLDIYLYEFLDQPDIDFLDLIASTSDESDDEVDEV